MTSTLRSLLPCLALAALGASATASDLTLDGQADASPMSGTSLTVSITGTPGAPVTLLIDVDPGPTNIFGQSLELGFTPALLAVPLGTMPGSGTLSFDANIPFDEAFVGLTFYTLAVVQDGAGSATHDYSNGGSIHITDRDVNLAGRSIATYPHVEFARSFNVGTTLDVAIDPTLHPETAGLTADVYVTAPQGRGQWINNPALVDVRGAPTTVTFSGADLAANTFLLDAGTLAAATGPLLGQAYDVVVDFGQDGLFDDDDLIDGFDDDEDGLYVVRDLTQPGPFPVSEATYTGGSNLAQNLFYPSNIANLGELELVIVSHGNGHNYQWYDHIGEHLASYGFVVMSHFNNTQPGVESASTTTLTNTDYFLGNLDIIEGGLLDGHVETESFFWLGHSRGGEGVARAYDRLFDGTYVANNFVKENVVLISSIAPVDFLGTNSSNPHAVDYHLWVGGSDSDVNGCASNDIAQPIHIFGRAEQKRMAISLHGVGHGNFHNGGGNQWATGPCLVGTSSTHAIMRGHVLPLAAFHLRGDLAAEDYLWRQWEGFRPIGAPDGNPCVHVDLMYREGDVAGKFVVDDFQSNAALGLSSSGGSVGGTVGAVSEARLDDPDSNFTADGDAMNGMTEGRASDSTAGLVFEWSNGGTQELNFGLTAAGQDASTRTWLSFRAAQSTRDALTTAALEDLTFEAVLIDADGDESAISVGAWGGGIEEPYQRTGCGTGTGWNNEFETVRIRLSDFRHGNPDLDLDTLDRVTFRFGPSHGSGVGRIGFDDLEFVD